MRSRSKCKATIQSVHPLSAQHTVADLCCYGCLPPAHFCTWRARQQNLAKLDWNSIGIPPLHNTPSHTQPVRNPGRKLLGFHSRASTRKLLDLQASSSPVPGSTTSCLSTSTTQAASTLATMASRTTTSHGCKLLGQAVHHHHPPHPSAAIQLVT